MKGNISFVCNDTNKSLTRVLQSLPANAVPQVLLDTTTFVDNQTAAADTAQSTGYTETLSTVFNEDELEFVGSPTIPDLIPATGT